MRTESIFVTSPIVFHFVKVQRPSCCFKTHSFFAIARHIEFETSQQNAQKRIGLVCRRKCYKMYCKDCNSPQMRRERSEEGRMGLWLITLQRGAKGNLFNQLFAYKLRQNVKESRGRGTLRFPEWMIHVDACQQLVVIRTKRRRFGVFRRFYVLRRVCARCGGGRTENDVGNYFTSAYCCFSENFQHKAKPF